MNPQFLVRCRVPLSTIRTPHSFAKVVNHAHARFLGAFVEQEAQRPFNKLYWTTLETFQFQQDQISPIFKELEFITLTRVAEVDAASTKYELTETVGATGLRIEGVDHNRVRSRGNLA